MNPSSSGEKAIPSGNPGRPYPHKGMSVSTRHSTPSRAPAPCPSGPRNKRPRASTRCGGQSSPLEAAGGSSWADISVPHPPRRPGGVWRSTETQVKLHSTPGCRTKVAIPCSWALQYDVGANSAPKNLNSRTKCAESACLFCAPQSA